MSKGLRELQDLMQAVTATPGWEVEEKTREWHIYPPLAGTYVLVKKMTNVPAQQLRNIGTRLEKAGWTPEVAKQAIREAGRAKTAAVRKKAERKAAELLGKEDQAEPEQADEVELPVYEAKTIGDATFMPPGPLGIDEKYSVDSVLLTPELAQKFLDVNLENNRHATEGRITDIAGDILAGRWKENGDRLRFGKLKEARGGGWTYRLLDGQKRCHAVIEAGIGVPVDIVYNLNADVFDTIDIQQSRTGDQSLYMRGVPNSNQISAGIKVVWLYDERPQTGSWSVRLTNPHLNELYDSDPQGWQSTARHIHNIMQQATKADRSLFAQRCLFGCYYVARRAYPTNQKLDQFFGPLILGLSDTSDPRFKLRRLLDHEADLGLTKTPKRHMALLLRTYNMFMKDPTTKRIDWDDGDQMPLPVHGG